MSKKVAFFLSMILTTHSFAENTTIQEYLFEPDMIYPVHTALGVVTQIELSPREKIKDFSSGLSNGWELARRENVFYLKPKDVAVDTNFIVRTEAHQYIFELKVINHNWKKLSDIKSKGINYQIKFRYPSSTDFNVQPSKLSGYSIQYDSSRSYHMNYAVAADAKSQWLIPLKVYDDGKFTYIHLNKGKFTGDFPVVYGRKNEKGEEFVLNSNVQDSVLVIHGTYPVLVLRHGNNVVGLRRN